MKNLTYLIKLFRIVVSEPSRAASICRGDSVVFAFTATSLISYSYLSSPDMYFEICFTVMTWEIPSKWKHILGCNGRIIDSHCGLMVRVHGYNSRDLGFDSRRYQIFRLNIYDFFQENYLLFSRYVAFFKRNYVLFLLCFVKCSDWRTEDD
jgi:hypothetical protein